LYRSLIPPASGPLWEFGIYCLKLVALLIVIADGLSVAFVWVHSAVIWQYLRVFDFCSCCRFAFGFRKLTFCAAHPPPNGSFVFMGGRYGKVGVARICSIGGVWRIRGGWHIVVLVGPC